MSPILSKSFSCDCDALRADTRLAMLQEINLAGLRNGSDLEVRKLSQAALNDGFFYLNLRDPATQFLLDQVDYTFQLSKSLFDHSIEVKNLFDIDKISLLKSNGYKPRGRNIVNKEGAKDGHESWTLPRNGILKLGGDSFPHLPVVAEAQNALQILFKSLEDIAQTIFRSLSNVLSLAAEHRLETLHQIEKPSTNVLRILKYEASTQETYHTPIAPHTDLGSLTFLFSSTPGLQVLPALGGVTPQRQEDWMYIAPKPGHAVVNLGDCLSMMTNGALKSAVHRVGPLPGASMPERHSFGYFIRPNDDAILRPLRSPLIPSEGRNVQPVTCAEWIMRKYKVLRAEERTPQDDDQVLTSGRKVFV
ncbi:hypothetical protein O1611_g6297 [Lasiodiplodia mahajangana]|uniref:Uncharacterized protein n=1 Tax=Lasiodiplodia mahajangana TaxID=1108764 RepID=A0ACC2JIK6_9PEZI|nr:hypothetical protein O1611_g6297 [Lasiodiplodia mahajangana]